MRGNIEIEKRKLLLVEGDDDQGVFLKLIKAFGIEDVQVISLGGKDHLNVGLLESIKKASGFRNIVSLGIVRDADENQGNVFNALCGVLEKCGLAVPERPMEFFGENPKVGVLILPPDREKGALEDLCLASLEGRVEMDCIEEYFRCLQDRLSPESFPKNLAKAKIQAFLASQRESVPKLGIAAQRGYIPFEHEVFSKIKDFIRDL